MKIKKSRGVYKKSKMNRRGREARDTGKVQ